MRMLIILIGVEISKGLEESIIINKSHTIFDWSLDYEGIPFKCVQCHVYVHLEKECSLYFRRKIWVHKEQKDGKGIY
jgi:hypothetical protein